MVDVTIVIMLSPPSHPLKTPEAEASRSRRGDIFTVFRSVDVAVLNSDGDWQIPDMGTKTFGYIHVRNVPRNMALRMRDVLGADTGETAERIKLDPETGEEYTAIFDDAWRSRRFRIPRSVMPPAARDKLLTDREITVGWTAFRSRIRKKIVVSRLNPTTDNETTAVTDDDLG